MNPVTIGNATLYLGDCLEIMPTLGEVDAVVTDPPYGIGENWKKNISRGTSSLKWKCGKIRDYGEYDWDKAPAPKESIDLIREISRLQVIWGGNFFHLPPSPCWLVWDKVNGVNDFADCELAWTNLKGAVRQFKWMWNGFQKQAPESRYHPTQKPVALMRWCIEKLKLPEGATILDPYLGSGTTGVAAVEMGYRFIGIEIHEPYFQIACERIERAQAQARLAI